jgi:integrase
MARKRKGNRVLGPHSCKDRNRWRVIRVKVVGAEEDGAAGVEGVTAVEQRKTYYFDTRKEALAFAKLLDDAKPGGPARIMSNAIDAYEIYLRDERHRGKRSVATTISRLRHFFDVSLHRGIGDATSVPYFKERIETRKQAEQQRRQQKGRGPGVDSTAGELRDAKAFVTFMQGQGWISVDVAERIKKLKVEGKRNYGKGQLRIDEARRYWKTALEEVRKRPGHHGPIVALLPLACGIDGGEIFRRRVRDLDDGGRLLWIEEGKTKNRNGRVSVPDELVEHLLGLAEGRPGDAWLFPSQEDAPHYNTFGADWVHKICDLAGVPRVCPHGLRGTLATLATDVGVAQQEVARALRHGDSGQTAERHYIRSGATRQARNQAGVNVIQADFEQRKRVG